jgi:hypothetical protein
MREANELLLALSGASSSAGAAAAAAAASPDVLASIDELTELGYECDASGCVLVLPGARGGARGAAHADGSPMSSWDDAGDGSAAAAPRRLKRLLSGDDWKLGPLTSAGAVPASATEFAAVVTGPAWSFLLTRSELASFLEVLQRLRSVVQNLDGEGQWNAQEGGRPASRVKWAAGRFSCVATHAAAPAGGSGAGAGKQQPHFSLDVALLTPDSRLVQGSWPAHVVAAACAALDKEGLAAPEAGQRAAGLAPTAAMA